MSSPGRARTRGRLAVVLAAGLAVVGVATAAGWWSRGRGWGPQAPGTPLPSLGAQMWVLDAPDIVRRGPARVVAVQLPGEVELVPYHFAALGLPGPLTAADWAKRLGAPLVVNAGQFDVARQHLGWLKGDDTWISRRRKRDWMGLVVSGPRMPGPWAQLVDLEVAESDVVERYRHAVQSMMLVDESARVRVRQSERAACRTVIAQNRRGRLLILVTEGAVTLWDLAAWLPSGGLDIVRAMNLDGGVESQLAIDTAELSHTFYGQYGADAPWLGDKRERRALLPAVAAVGPAHARRAAPVAGASSAAPSEDAGPQG